MPPTQITLKDTAMTFGARPPADASRDACHVATIAVVAGNILTPGEHVGPLADGTYDDTSESLVGIVDPFRRGRIEKGDRFWLFLYPGTITSLQHVWTHPLLDGLALPAPAAEPQLDRVEARQWLNVFCEQWGMHPDDVLQNIDTRNGITADRDIHGWDELAIEEQRKFWACVETLLGRRFDTAHREDTYFSCAC